VIRDEDEPAGRRDVLDPVRLGAEVVAVEPARDRRGGPHRVARHPERVVAELVAMDDERLRAACNIVLRHGVAKLSEAVEETHGEVL
jgi:hypothetical protein